MGFRVFCVPMFSKQSLQDWIWWRNHVVAPFSEEFTFRACMVPVLLGYYSHFWAIIISPLFFGVAHFHHMVERIRKGHDILSSFLISMFQFTYHIWDVFCLFICQNWSFCSPLHCARLLQLYGLSRF